MKKMKLLAVMIGLAMLAGTVGITVGCKHMNSDEHGTHAHNYTCPMHPEVMQNSPGKCSKCGMDLVHKD